VSLNFLSEYIYLTSQSRGFTIWSKLVSLSISSWNTKLSRKSSRPDISYVVHQCARFSYDPKITHGHAIIYLVKYLHGTMDKWILFHPNDDYNLYCHVDADFCGSWFKLTAMHDASTAKSRTSFVITYANCPVSWSSKFKLKWPCQQLKLNTPQCRQRFEMPFQSWFFRMNSSLRHSFANCLRIILVH